MNKIMSRTSYLTSYNSILTGRFLKPPTLRGSTNTTADSPRRTSPSNNISFYFILVSAAPASRTLSTSNMNFRSQSLSIAESNKTLELFSGGYSDTLVDKMIGAEVNTRGTRKEERGRGGE